MIKHFAVVDANGVIQMGVTRAFPEPENALMLPDGWDCVEIETQFLRNNSSPTAIAKVDGRKVVWEEVGPLGSLKAHQKAQVTAAYLLANRTSFTFLGKEIQADEHAMKQITVTDAGIRRRGAMHPQWRGFWKALDNSYVPVPDVAAWNAMMDALEAQGNANFDRAQNLKGAIDEALTPEEISGINW